MGQLKPVPSASADTTRCPSSVDERQEERPGVPVGDFGDDFFLQLGRFGGELGEQRRQLFGGEGFAAGGGGHFGELGHQARLGGGAVELDVLVGHQEAGFGGAEFLAAVVGGDSDAVVARLVGLAEDGGPVVAALGGADVDACGRRAFRWRRSAGRRVTGSPREFSAPSVKSTRVPRITRRPASLIQTWPSVCSSFLASHSTACRQKRRWASPNPCICQRQVESPANASTRPSPGWPATKQRMPARIVGFGEHGGVGLEVAAVDEIRAVERRQIVPDRSG